MNETHTGKVGKQLHKYCLTEIVTKEKIWNPIRILPCVGPVPLIGSTPVATFLSNLTWSLIIIIIYCPDICNYIKCKRDSYGKYPVLNSISSISGNFSKWLQHYSYYIFKKFYKDEAENKWCLLTCTRRRIYVWKFIFERLIEII